MRAVAIFLALFLPLAGIALTVTNSSKNKTPQEELKDIQTKEIEDLRKSLEQFKATAQQANEINDQLEEKVGAAKESISEGGLLDSLSPSEYDRPLTESEEKVRVQVLKFLSVFSDSRVIRALGPLSVRFKEKRFHMFGAGIVFILLMWTYRNFVKKQLSGFFKRFAFSIMCMVVSFVGVSIIIPTIFLGLAYFNFIESVYMASARIYKWDTTYVVKVRSYLPDGTSSN